MKKLLILVFVAASFSACQDGSAKVDTQAVDTQGAKALTSIQWSEPKKELGTINEGQKLQISFHLKNTGDAPLILQSVVPGCGCTVADYPKEPIAPGKEADITASFDSKGREGQQHKEITVTANTKESSQHMLSFNVMVLKAKS